MAWAQELPEIRDCKNCGIVKDEALKPENAQPRTDRRVGSVLARVDIVFTEIVFKKLKGSYCADNAQMFACVDFDRR